MNGLDEILIDPVAMTLIFFLLAQLPKSPLYVTLPLMHQVPYADAPSSRRAFVLFSISASQPRVRIRPGGASLDGKGPGRPPPLGRIRREHIRVLRL